MVKPTWCSRFVFTVGGPEVQSEKYLAGANDAKNGDSDSDSRVRVNSAQESRPSHPGARRTPHRHRPLRPSHLLRASPRLSGRAASFPPSRASTSLSGPPQRRRVLGILTSLVSGPLHKNVFASSNPSTPTRPKTATHPWSVTGHPLPNPGSTTSRTTNTRSMNTLTDDTCPVTTNII